MKYELSVVLEDLGPEKFKFEELKKEVLRVLEQELFLKISDFQFSKRKTKKE